MAESEELNRPAPPAETPANSPVQSENTINVLKGLEPVRQRPGMYIGDVNSNGLHQLVYEVVDNSIDEALAGYCHNIEVTIGLDNSITVKDDGRGIPVTMHTTEHKPQCEVALTMLHAGGKFNNDVYKFSGGLHGVGVSCVNALSDWLVLTIDRDGQRHQMRFSRGKVTDELKILGPATGTGTTVQYHPDPTVFEVLVYNYDILARRLRELAYLNAGVRITLSDLRGGEPRSEVFHFEGGVPEFVKFLNRGKLEVDPEAKDKKGAAPPPVISFDGETKNFRSDGSGDFFYNVAFQYNFSYNELIYSFVNGINTKDGGTHLTGFLTAFTRLLNNLSRKYDEEETKKKGGKAAVAAKQAKSKAAKGGEDEAGADVVTSEDVRKGLSAVISVKVENPLFESQTKTKLNNPEVNGLMQSATTDAMKTYFEEHPQEAKWIIEHVRKAAEARRKAREIIERTMNPSEAVAHLLGKLSDCSCKDPSQCELYIVEGDSAGGSAKSGRESAYQAILPIRGKLINAEKATVDKLLRNEEIRTLCTAIGAGAYFGGTASGAEGDWSQVDVSKARYHRIVIMTDADVDGSHIRTLVLTFLFRHLRPLVEAGYVYVARPPLFKISKGKHEEYVETEDDMSGKLTSLGIRDLALRLPGRDNLPPEAVSNVIQDIRECLRLCANLPRYGIRQEEFFQAYAGHGAFPQYLVEIREEGVLKSAFAWSREEAEAMVLAAEERRQARLAAAAAEKAAEADGADAAAPAEAGEAPEDTAAAAPADEKPAETQFDEDGNPIAVEETTRVETDNRWISLPEGASLDAQAKRLAECGLSIADLYTSEKPVVEMVDEKQEVSPFKSLNDLCEAVTARGRRGLTIQRFKGLGEMSPDELWETTMNPKTRSMIKVTVEDAAAADAAFNLLMGDEVGPRRAFIEENADKVLNPDI